MPYGVVACPTCRKAKGFPVGARSTECPVCGRRLSTERLVTVTAADEAELQRIVGETNARLAAASPEELASMEAPVEARAPPSDALAAAVRAARAVSGEVARSDAVARALTATRGEFTEAQLAEAMDVVGLGAAKAAPHLKRMLVAHVVYEPRPGVYRAL